VRRGDEDWRSHLFAQGLFAINPTWRWGFGVETASDDLYLQRYDIDGMGSQRGLVRAQSSRLLSQLFTEGRRGASFYARALSVNFQDLTGGERRKATPWVAPMLEARRSFAMGPMDGRLDVFGSGLRLERREQRLDSTRVTAGAQWRGQQVMGRGLVIEPSLFARADWFSYNNVTPGQSDSFGRALGYANLDVRWPLQRLAGPVTWTVEPRLMLTLASEDTDQARVFNEDSLTGEFDATALFRPNGAAGYSLWDGGASVTVGVQTGARIGDSTQVSWFVGQRLRDGDRAFAGRASNLDRSRSDIVTAFDATWDDRLSLNGLARFDSGSGELTRMEVSALGSLGPVTASVRYHELPSDVAGPVRANREIVGGLTARITDSWSVFATGWRDLLNERNLRERYGITYTDDCTDFRLFFDRVNTTNRFVEPSTSVRFEIAFRTLGVLDSDPLDE
jgi:LPS-assembly protein